MVEWAIVGGGIHGTTIAHSLITRGYAARDEIRIIDPHPELLYEWKRATANVGMEFLRSPGVHHIDTEPFSLKHFAGNNSGNYHLFTEPNERPSLALFNAHAEDAIRRSRLSETHLQEIVTGIELLNGSAQITTSGQALKARKVILAIGSTGSARWPEWAREARTNGARISHVLEPSYSRENIPETGRIIVIGGGMSGVQTALSLATSDRHVTLLSPKPLRYNNYDADPGWMGPKFLGRFRSISSPVRRRDVIQQARNSGSVTYELKRSLMQKTRDKLCDVATGTISSCSVLTSDLMMLSLSDGQKIGANYIILATGYSSKRPGGRLVDNLIADHNLECSPCGFPITGPDLRWSENLYVTGPLAELEVGPVSRNIIGARMAAERIMMQQSKRIAV